MIQERKEVNFGEGEFNLPLIFIGSASCQVALVKSSPSRHVVVEGDEEGGREADVSWRMYVLGQWTLTHKGG